jgi:3-hydroxyacyl-[acyl-carrier-protein] dehydratase
MALIDTLPKPTVSDCLFDYAAIQQILPHRYPFLFIDKVMEIELEKKIICQKNVTFNEPHFLGHFPNDPVMPGVLQLEAMAQAGCLLIMLSFEEQTKGKRPAFMGVENSRFRKPVRPGDILRIESELESFRRGIGKWQSKIFVGETLVSESLSIATMV